MPCAVPCLAVGPSDAFCCGVWRMPVQRCALARCIVLTACGSTAPHSWLHCANGVWKHSLTISCRVLPHTADAAGPVQHNIT
jgi:hypothetical protein